MSAPKWSIWRESHPYSVGIEEEVMLLEPRDWSLAQLGDEVVEGADAELSSHLTPETHGSAVELSTKPHERVADAALQLHRLRCLLAEDLRGLDLRAASAGTHPSTVWHETTVSDDERYKLVYGSMRELARREPTFALHVHVGVPDAESGIRLLNRLRAHLPLLLALSANSPFWQGRDTGLASARTPLFQAFPRVGIPRAFHDYSDWVEAVDLLISCDAFPEPTFLWWDVRPQPRFGTVEIRILDAQTTVAETAALTALIQCIARLELEEGYVSDKLVNSPEVLDENRFLAARDGMKARLIDPQRGRREPVQLLAGELLNACRPHARALDCEAQIEGVRALTEEGGAARQLELGTSRNGLARLVASLAQMFEDGPPPETDADASTTGSELAPNGG